MPAFRGFRSDIPGADGVSAQAAGRGRLEVSRARNGPGPGPQTGIDLVELARVRRLLQENPAAWQGMSTGRERQAWSGVAGAACVLAAKEAVLKALQGPGADEVEWDQIEVLPGLPLQINLHGDLAEWARRHRPGRWVGSAAARGSLAVAWVLWVPQEHTA